MAVQFRVRGGAIALQTVPVSAAEPGRLYQIVRKEGAQAGSCMCVAARGVAWNRCPRA